MDTVDLSNLRNSIGDDKELEAELFEEFITSSQDQLDTLERHIADGQDKEAWRSAAHALKGTSTNLGAAHLGKLCKEAQESYEADLEVKKSLFQNLKCEREDVVKFLNREMESGG